MRNFGPPPHDNYQRIKPKPGAQAACPAAMAAGFSPPVSFLNGRPYYNKGATTGALHRLSFSRHSGHKENVVPLSAVVTQHQAKQRGRAIHKGLALEHTSYWTSANIEPTTTEDAWALQMLQLQSSLVSLMQKGRADDLVLDQTLRVIEIKTRKKNYLPLHEDAQHGRLQAMLYRHFLIALLDTSNLFDFAKFFTHLRRVNPRKPFSKKFQRQMAPRLDRMSRPTCLDHLGRLLTKQIADLRIPLVDKTMEVVYFLQQTNPLFIGTEEFFTSDLELESILAIAMQWWQGEPRKAQQVDPERRNRCIGCPFFKPICVKEKEEEVRQWGSLRR
ncbi:exonuclease V [Roridomyces roridus]|uniref:Exonuclease V n=1 Tax=Roridomyces roridus TaxID=1738132 RepID=A0AAD7FXF5_9AGAR|nr:exonuclease V [Roridomyces roridus]